MGQLREKKLKRALCLLLVLAMLLTAFPLSALAVPGEGAEPVASDEAVGIQPASLTMRQAIQLAFPGVPIHEVSTDAGFHSAITGANGTWGAHRIILLQGNVARGGTNRAINIPDGRTVRIFSDRIDGEAYSFSNTQTGTPTDTAANRRSRRHFDVQGVLHLYNVNITRDATLTTNFGGVEVRSGGHLHMHGRLISPNVDPADMPDMAPATISNNRAPQRGGGVVVYSGTLTMNADAVITNNTSLWPLNSSTSGGGIAIDTGGTANINNGIISHNHANNHGGGISVAWGGSGSANLNINGMRLLNNNAGGNGGGIHSNTAANITMQGLIFINGNRANAGGGMRIFSNSSTSFSLSPGSQISDNIARGNGAGISIAHTTGSNANNIGLRINGVEFHRNLAVGIGGAIHHEGPNMAADRGIVITNSSFIGNRASHGGAISMVVTSGNNNNLPTNAHASRLTICEDTVFSGNSATSGLLVDENLAAQNEDHVRSTGSTSWYGVRIHPETGDPISVGVRNHVWNNYDIITRNRFEARTVHYNVIGSAAGSSTMTATLTTSSRPLNHQSQTVGPATPGSTTINLPIPFTYGSTIMRHSEVTFTVTSIPWNAEVIYWANTQTVRTFVPGASPEYDTFSFAPTRTEITPNPENPLVQMVPAYEFTRV